jgi:hypothetical protein
MYLKQNDLFDVLVFIFRSKNSNAHLSIWHINLEYRKNIPKRSKQLTHIKHPLSMTAEKAGIFAFIQRKITKSCCFNAIKSVI